MIELPMEPDAVSGADWLELSCLADHPTPISRSVIVTYLERLGFEYELLSTDIFRHVEWRASVLPSYPIHIDKSRIRSKCKYTDALQYVFPLLLSTHDLYPDTTVSNWTHVGGLFELFCTASLRQLIGNAVLIGNKEYSEFATDFDECLIEVCRILNERKGPKHPKSVDFKDAGVDVIAWKNLDKRTGQIVVLAQCASGKNWRKKGGDIITKLWRELVFWTVDPIKALAFPYAFDFDSPQAKIEWSFYAYDSGLLLDRLRLAKSELPNCEIDIDPILAWSDKQMGKIESHKIE